jgi:hypothetical protein
MNKKNLKILKPSTVPIELEGKMTYNEHQRAWGILRLRKEILSEFPELRERNEKIRYKILFSRDFSKLDEQIALVKKTIGVSPLLVWFVKE